MNNLVNSIKEAGKRAAAGESIREPRTIENEMLQAMSTLQQKRYIRALYRSFSTLVDSIMRCAMNAHDGIITYDQRWLTEPRLSLDAELVLRHFTIPNSSKAYITDGGGVLMVDQDGEQLLAITPVFEHDVNGRISMLNKFKYAVSRKTITQIRIVDEFGAWMKYSRTTPSNVWSFVEVFNPNAIFGDCSGFQIPIIAEEMFRQAYQLPTSHDSHHAFRTFFRAACVEAERNWLSFNPNGKRIEWTKQLGTVEPFSKPTGYRRGYTLMPQSVPPSTVHLINCVKGICDVRS